ncbi:MAG: hypothetical protein EPN82_14730 [Bacteroidetes bacterium]|nr:MAG: hypothetical protein EPN82_14730 [Bacteroidota bacterium]
MKLKTIFSLLLIFILNGCGDSSTDETNSKKEIWPLAVGNSWTYYVYSYHRYNEDTVKPYDTITYYVSGKKTLNGEDWFYFSAVGRSIHNLMINRNDGFWGINFKDSNNINIDSAVLLYRYPTYLNETYPTDTNGLKTISLNTLVTSSAGDFNCIFFIGIKSNEKLFLSPGFGLIKNELITNINTNVNPPDTNWIRMLLGSYIINKK